MTTPTFILELPIQDGDDVSRFLKPKFSFGTQVYNATLHTALGRLQRLRESQAWRDACTLTDKAERNKELTRLRKEAGLTEYGLVTVANDHRNAAKRFVPVTTPGAKGKRKPDGECILGAHVAQTLGKRVWRAVERYMFGKGGRPRFKSQRRQLSSLEGQCANATIIWKPSAQAVVWNKRPMKVLVPETPYVEEALRDPLDPQKPRRIKYCRIVRRNIRGHERYFLQLAMEGRAPVRHVYAPTSERVGIDPGPRKITVYSHAGVFTTPVATVEDHQVVIRRIQRGMDRSKRATNPDNYNEDGTCKTGHLQWTFSKNYERLRAALAEIYRRLAQTRKRDHGTLVNLVLSLGGRVAVEKNSYKSYQRNFGKSTNQYGVGSLVTRLANKAASAGSKFVELNAYRLCLSRYEHVNGTYCKKPLGQRWTLVGDCVVQRDAYSAFLAAFADDKGHDRSLLRKEWTRAEPLLRAAGLCRDFNPATDGDLSKSTREPVFAVHFRQSGMQLEAFRKSGNGRSSTRCRKHRSNRRSRLGSKGIPSLQ